MIELEEIKNYLKLNLSDKRFKHSLNTAETALELANVFREDPQRAYISGLVHDCTRELDLALQQSMLRELGIQVDSLTHSNAELLHAYSAEYLIRQKFRIDDETIITAVKYHTTGKEAMELLEKIIFLSDVIEPSRSFLGIDNIRQLSKCDLDEALIEAFDSSIKFLIGKKATIHPDTIYARNFIITHLQNKKWGKLI
ncbi:MAG: bis(5'-nucleosyl)-tetraphosphatase (symmetrical) YqeK [Lutisporaceae bacterium]